MSIGCEITVDKQHMNVTSVHQSNCNDYNYNTCIAMDFILLPSMHTSS